MNQAKNFRFEQPKDIHVQDFLDMVAPSVVKFNTDYFICGNTLRSVWVLREYPASTEEQAILKLILCFRRGGGTGYILLSN